MPKNSPPSITADDLLSDLTDVYGKYTQQISNAWLTTKPLSIRHNSLLDPNNQALSELKSLGFTIDIQPWYHDAWIITYQNDDQKTCIEQLESTHSWRAGYLYRQNLASMIPPLLLELQPDQQVVDMTAAPGSKTSQIAALLNNTGTILANDVSRTRLYKLKANLESLGVTNTTIRQGLGERLYQQFPEVFDAALADVPCSMMGRINIHDPASNRPWSHKENKSLAKRQQWLLLSAISSVRVGGIVIYSTCTLNVLENEAVVDWVLRKSKRKLQIEPISIPAFPQQLDHGEQVIIPGVTSWREQHYHSDLNKTWRVVPNRLMEGFYVAKIRVLS